MQRNINSVAYFGCGVPAHGSAELWMENQADTAQSQNTRFKTKLQVGGAIMPKVGVVISNYNGWQDTLACLESLQEQTFHDFEIVLLDDASTNDSVQRLECGIKAAASLREHTVFLPQKENLGFAAVNNVGIRRALADGCGWVLLLNNDTVCAPDLLQTLLAQTPEDAVSCPKMFFMDPPDELWFAGGELDRKTCKVKHLGGHQKDSPAFSQKKQVNFITFCCVLLPRAVVERVGYLDESLFMYCEDVDYCIRLADAGVAMWYLPDAKLWHKAGGTAGGARSIYYVTRNTLRLANGGKPRWRQAAAGLRELLPGAARYFGTRLLGRKKGRSYGIYRGALDYLQGKTGRMDPKYLK